MKKIFIFTLLLSVFSFCGEGVAEDVIAPMQAVAHKALPLQSKKSLLEEAIKDQVLEWQPFSRHFFKKAS